MKLTFSNRRKRMDMLAHNIYILSALVVTLGLFSMIMRSIPYWINLYEGKF